MEPDDDKTQSHVPLSKGLEVGHYRILDKIGAGGMGEVYLAEDTKLDRKVALKFLPPHLCQDEDCRKRFKREAQAAAKLSHPNIITIHEVSEYQGRPFFGMEHIEGRSLKEYASGKDLSIEQILELGIQICEGLNVAHQKGVIHRDIKPSNILIDSHGRARIVDFGLASVVGSDQLTKTGSTLGTIGYMSPEQVQGRGIDHRSDLFSLGVVLYELITKQNPFKRDSEAATLKAVSYDTPHPLARYRSDVPDGLQAIIDKALQKDVKTRYQHADGILSDLIRIKRTLESGQSKVSEQLISGRTSGGWWIAATFIIIVAAIILIVTKPWISDKTPDEPDKIMLAVLPFENLGDQEDEYFADGITDEIISRLAGLHGLGVISRTSTVQYKKTEKNLREIGSELGVEYILEGTIRWDKSREPGLVRINPQLIRVADDVHLWADRYNAVINDIFVVQSNIAEEVAAALDITLLESEHRALSEQPAKNTEAYDYYLRGQEFLTSNEKDLQNALLMFQKAIELEPDFVLAYTEFAFAHIQLYWWYFDRSEQRLRAAREALDRALEIAPDHPRVRGTLGWYYYHGHLDYDRALEEFTILRKKQPANALAIYCIALIERRQSKWENAVENFGTALKLNPRSETFSWEFAYTLSILRRFQEAYDYYERAIELAPDLENAYTGKSTIHVYWKGDLDAARRVMAEAFRRINRSPTLTRHEIDLDIMAGDFAHALDLLAQPGAIRCNTAADTAYYYNLKGDIYRYMKRIDLMKKYYDSARIILEKIVLADPDDPSYHSDLSWSYAGLGRKQEAIREGQRAIELMPVSKDAMEGANLVENLASIYTIIGEYDQAIDQLEYVLSIPSEVTAAFLKIWPDYAPLRENPRFQALIKEYEKEHAT